MLHNTGFIFILGMFTVIAFIPLGYGEIIGKNLGPVNDLLVTDSALYFFEPDDSMQLPTWIHDTRIMKITPNGINKVSDSLFIYPTELNNHGEFLYFATLSDQCIGQILCDYQNIIKMSITDGSYKKIISDLKSAIHISIDEEYLIVSESSGRIWHISFDGNEKKLLYSGENLIMDLTAENGNVYWIEEIEDQNSQVLGLLGEELEVIQTDLIIPYDLRSEGDFLHWNDLQVKSIRGNVGEFTTITILKNNDMKSIIEFETTSPISPKDKPTFGPYRAYGNHVFFINNTESKSIIHLKELGSNHDFELAEITDYRVKFLRNDNSTLYVVGSNNDGFLIEKIPLPITIPEFPSNVLLVTTFVGLSSIIVAKQSFRL